MFRFYSCELIVVWVYSLIPQAGFLLIRTSVFMILWLTNDNEHIDHFKLNLVLQHKYTPKCPVAPPSILPGYHYSLPLTVNRHSPNVFWSWLIYWMNCLLDSVCLYVSLSVCVLAWVSEWVSACLRYSCPKVQDRPGFSTVYRCKVYYSTMYFIEKVHKANFTV